MNRIDGRYLRDLRKEHGYSIRAFADKIYSSKSTVQRWEQSFLPEDECILEKVAAIFKLTTDDFRRQSLKKYGNKNTINDNEYTPEQLNIMKYGIKYLLITLMAMSGMLIAIFAFIFI